MRLLIDRFHRWFIRDAEGSLLLDRLLPGELQPATDVSQRRGALVDANGKPIEGAKVLHENYQDLVWALINTKEFLFNH